MKKVISVRDVEELVRRGADLSALPEDAIYTPSARDLLRESKSTLMDRGARSPAVLQAARPAASDSNPSSEVDRFFCSPEMETLKKQICDIGHRIWTRAYVDGNGGNISIRVGENRVLCTPTLVSKGFMKPEDMCLVDLEGNQLAGKKKRTSEILMHLQIMKAQPKAKAVVHAHPPYATAFAVSGVRPPTCMIPEMEVFCGEVAIAPYYTPGTPEMGREVASLADKHNTILMANHGVVAWSHLGVEDAYFKMEIIEAYCRTVVVTTQLGITPKTFSPAQLQELLKIKQGLGVVDARHGLKECELCDNSDWRPGVNCVIPAVKPDEPGLDPAAEELVRKITDNIVEKLSAANR
ncbi:MAG TPA: class II aldolase/adducin family protein [Candidatus Paceibacterota bacterium]|nr:class II aldolase/adducin family protein [Verrucomicrobiota bacterium]HRY50280.1 class II aldolase/adducin family protein [Candidatus Paceibacterota bacterium]